MIISEPLNDHVGKGGADSHVLVGKGGNETCTSVRQRCKTSWLGINDVMLMGSLRSASLRTGVSNMIQYM